MQRNSSARFSPRRPRDSYVLATKLYFPVNGDRGLSREQVFKQIDPRSAGFAPTTSISTSAIATTRRRRSRRRWKRSPRSSAQGKARYLGFSEWTADQIRAALALVPDVEKFVSSQPQYSLLYRVPEREVIPLCKENGISQIVWSPLAQGALTGKYKPGEEPAAGTRAASQQMGWAMDSYRDDEVLASGAAARADRRRPRE